MQRRDLLVWTGAGLALLGAPGAGLLAPAGPARAARPLGEAHPDDHVLGASDAPVTMVEYASLTCPHCAAFHNDTWPRLKSAWVETGKVKFVYRHYPLDRLALRGALLAECFEGQRFFTVVDMLFKQQSRWSRADNPMRHFARLGGLAGLDQERFEACMTDEDTRDAILEAQIRARDEAGVQSTPSFLIAGELMTGNQGYDAFAARLRAAVG